MYMHIYIYNIHIYMYKCSCFGPLWFRRPVEWPSQKLQVVIAKEVHKDRITGGESTTSGRKNHRNKSHHKVGKMVI